MKSDGRGKMAQGYNVEYRLLGADGTAKRMFVENALGAALLRLFRLITPEPISPAGQVKPGAMNYLAAYGLRVPFMTGGWTFGAVRANLITNAGFAGLASRINGSGGEAAFTYIALGIGATAANVADTTLGSEITTNGGQRANSTVSRVTTDVTNDTAQDLNTFTFTGSFAITESGVLNAASSGTLLARQVFSAINVASGDQLQVTWKFDVDQGA